MSIPIQSASQPHTAADLAEEMERALDHLASPHREAVLLRFYRAHSLGEVGHMLGISEDAARKRVDRALDSLRQLLAARGIAIATSALPAAFTDLAAPAPSHLLATASAFSTSSVSAAAATIANQAGLALALASLKTASIVAAIALISASGVVGVLMARSDPRPATVASTQSAAPSPAPEPARTLGEFYVGGGAKTLVGPEPRIGVYSLSGRTLRLNHALAAAGLDLARNQHLHLRIIRRDSDNAERAVELPISSLRGVRDLPLQANDLLQIHDPPAQSATISTGPLQVTLNGLVAPNQVLTLIEPLDVGEVNLPLIGYLRIVGLSPADAAATINRGYRDANLMQDAQASVAPLDISGQWLPLGPLQPGQSIELRLGNQQPAPDTRVKLTLSPEGTVDLPGGRPIKLAGLTECEAERAICEAYHRGRWPLRVLALHRTTEPLPQDPPKPPVHPRLGDMYDILGDVPKPGRYTTRTDHGPETLLSALKQAEFNLDCHPSTVIAVRRAEDQALIIRRVADLLDAPARDLPLLPGDLVLVPPPDRAAIDRPYEYYLTGAVRAGAYYASGPITYRQTLTSAGYTPQPRDQIMVFAPDGDGTRVSILSAADVFAHDTPLFDVSPGVILSVSPQQP